MKLTEEVSCSNCSISCMFTLTLSGLECINCHTVIPLCRCKEVMEAYRSRQKESDRKMKLEEAI